MLSLRHAPSTPAPDHYPAAHHDDGPCSRAYKVRTVLEARQPVRVRSRPDKPAPGSSPPGQTQYRLRFFPDPGRARVRSRRQTAVTATPGEGHAVLARRAGRADPVD